MRRGTFGVLILICIGAISEVRAEPEKFWTIMSEFSVGAQRSDLWETNGLLKTNTNGLWGFPRVFAGGRLRPVDGIWSGGLYGQLAPQWRVQGMSFPVAWLAGVDVKRHRALRFWERSTIGVRGALEFEQFSQASPNRAAATPRFVDRETTALWMRGAGDVHFNSSRHRSRLQLALGFAPWAQTGFSNTTGETDVLRGLKAELGYRVYLEWPFFVEAASLVRRVWGSGVTLDSMVHRASVGVDFW